MKSLLLFLAVAVMFSAAAVNADINLDDGPYYDDFSTAKYLTDALEFDPANVYIPVTDEESAEEGNLECLTFFQAENGTRPYIDYGFTRSDVSKPGVVAVDLIDYASGNQSWIYLYYDCDSAEWLDDQFSGNNYQTEDNGTNLMGINPPGLGHLRCRFEIPTGADRMYFRFCPSSYNGFEGGYHVGIDNLMASADGSELDPKNVIYLTAENPTYSDGYDHNGVIGPQRWEQEAYKLTGSVMQMGGWVDDPETPEDESALHFYGFEASIAYKFEVPGGTNQITLTLDADDQTGSNSWIGPRVWDESGALIYHNNMTNLGGGGLRTATIDLPEGTRSFMAGVASYWGAENPVNDGLAPFISKVNGKLRSFSVTANNVGSLIDGEPDGDVDSDDLGRMADSWLDTSK
jgi:hypothetical protein